MMVGQRTNILAREGDDITNKKESVGKIFNEYFNQIASDILMVLMVPVMLLLMFYCLSLRNITIILV